MSTLEKIVFVADYIEPNRKQLPSLDEIRTLAFQDITKAVERIAMSTIEFLNDQDVYIDRYIYELISDEV